MHHKNKALIISTVELSGPKQMEIDLSLLNKTNLDKEIMFTLRFYLWEGNWISIGFHQKNIPEHWLELSKNGLLNIVRRPSGGGAVLHCGGITYALTFTKPEYKIFSYQKINQWLIKSFSDLGIKLQNGTIKKTLIKENCFGTCYVNDLIDQNGFKRIGSAQFWKERSFLQHGEILINPPNDLWFNIFQKNAPPPLQIELNNLELIDYLKNSFLKNYADESIKNLFLSYDEFINY